MKAKFLLSFVFLFWFAAQVLAIQTLVLKDGREIKIKGYEIRGSLVYITHIDDKKYSIRSDLVDFTATKYANQTPSTAPVAAGQGQDADSRTLGTISRAVRDRRGTGQREQRVLPMDIFREEKPMESLVGREDIGIPQQVFEANLKEDSVYPTASLALERVTNSAVIDEHLKISPAIRNSYRALMSFSMSKYRDMDVSSASLNLHVDAGQGSGNQPLLVRVGLITEPWDEKNLKTWRDCPPFHPLEGSLKVEGPGWYEFDVTRPLSAVATRGLEAAYGFILYADETAKDESQLKWINSNRFRQPEFWPRLRVTYLEPAATEKKTIAPTADVWVDQYKNAAFKDAELKLAGQFQRAGVIFLNFDFSQLNNSIINDAKLSLYLLDTTLKTGNVILQVGIPQRAWSYASVSDWNTVPKLGVEGPSFQVPPQSAWVDMDVTSVVRWAAYNGNPNGIMIFTTQNDYARFYSSRAKDEKNRPKLTINTREKARDKVTLAGHVEKREKEGLFDRFAGNLLSDVLEDPKIIKAMKVSFIPGMILGLLTLRWIEKRFAFLLGSGIVAVSVLSAIIAERFTR